MTGKVVSICALLLVITFVAYLSICLRQFSYLKPANYRLVILSVRCAALLPLCAFFIMISLLAPSSFVIMMLVITVVEGYCLYCFLALIVENFGGPFAIVDYLHKARKELAICGCIFPKEPLRFYQITTLAVFNIFVVRSALSLLAAICFYANTNAGRAFYVLFNATSACILLYGMVCTINLCKFDG